MTNFRIETTREFFEYIVVPDVTEFLEHELSLRIAYHACISLLSYRDWVLRGHLGKAWSAAGVSQTPLRGKEAFQKALQAYDHSFAIVKEIANFSKHMTESNSVLREIGAGAVGLNEMAPNKLGRIFTVRIGTLDHDVRTKVRASFMAWQSLNKENSW
jgi:hypothetical protein